MDINEGHFITCSYCANKKNINESEYYCSIADNLHINKGKIFLTTDATKCIQEKCFVPLK